MTSQSPRIYIYKITFEEVLYYYYGVHKEKKFGEEYWGSPKTNKWVWDFYTPKKQILQFFEFSEEGWLEAQEVETRLIRPFYQTDKWCLNESCGGKISLKILRECGKRVGLVYGSEGGKIGGKISGKITGKLNYKNKVGIHALSTEQIKENGRKGGLIQGKKNKENKIGIFGMTTEQKIEIGKKTYENKKGIHSRSLEKMSEDGKKGSQRARELNVGIFAQTREQKSESGKKGGKSVSSQVWECTVTGFRSNPGSLTCYQRKRKIDTSNRIRIS
jgi:hypothetical protein